MAKVFFQCKKCQKRFRRTKGYERICPECFDPKSAVINNLSCEIDRLKSRIVVLKKRISNPQTDRKKMIQKLGGRCMRCGYDDWRALQIDHVLGGGTKELRVMGGNKRKYYQEVLLNNNGKYQLLCANCNWIKRYENNE
jgi:hypothetical protein